MLDQIDVKILKSLLVDARTNFSELAKECGVSNTTIHNRYEKLKDAGIITGSTLLVNFKAFNFEVYASFFISIDNQQISDFTAYLRRFNLGIHYDPIKNYNVHIVTPLASFKEVEKLKEFIRKHPSVKEINSSIWTDWFFYPENLKLNYT